VSPDRATPGERLVLAGGRVFDGTAHPPVSDVALQAGRIADVGEHLTGDRTFDVSGCLVTPGLIDCHTHVIVRDPDYLIMLEKPLTYRTFEAAANLRDMLACGITTVRDAGGVDRGVRDAVRDGLIPGPRMLIAVSMISQTGGHADPWFPSGQDVATIFPYHDGAPCAVADGADQVRAMARRLLRCGADVLKVAASGGVLSATDSPHHAHYRPHELRALVEEARAAEVRVMAHAHAAAAVRAAVAAGVDSVEHGALLDDAAIDALAGSGTYLVPTLAAPHSLLGAASQRGLTPTVADKLERTAARHLASAARAVEAGVRIAMGSDSGFTPHGRNLLELELLRRAGMSAHEALNAATRNAAELLGLQDEIGTVEQGKIADLCVWPQQTLQLGAGDAPLMVFQAGTRTWAAAASARPDGTDSAGTTRAATTEEDRTWQ
jgi:imidazolonepropionase-like amidohydrolase